MREPKRGFPQSALRGALLLLALAYGFQAERAAACAGPCTEAAIWDSALVSGELNVVTNFGILRRTEQGFHLDCEELFGGLLSQAAFTGRAQVASTSVGFFRRGSDLCAWTDATAGASNSWFLDYALVATEPSTEDSDAGTSALNVYALLIDSETLEAKVEQATDNQPFHTLATFPSDSGLRQIVAGGSPTWVYAMGYTFAPRVWHVAFSGNAESATTEWQQLSFEEATPNAELRPLQQDPSAANQLWLQRSFPQNAADELVHFDASAGSLTPVFTLERSEKLVDIAFVGEEIYVAGSIPLASTLYVAQRDNLEFEVATRLPVTLTCFNRYGDEWLACNSDFTRSSPWLVARSEDNAAHWIPELTLQDLATVSSCGEVCNDTSGWLFGVFGAFGNGTSSDAGRRDFDAAPNSNSDRDAGMPGSDTSRPSCSCQLHSEPPGQLFALTLVLGVGLSLRRWYGKPLSA